MGNSSVHGTHAEHHLHPLASAIRERATPAKVPLAAVPSAERTVEPARIEVEEKELPFTD